MNSIKPGLYNASDYANVTPGTPEAGRNASVLISQAAKIALVCSLALDAVALGPYEVCDPREVSGTAAKMMFECYEDLTVALNLLDR